MVQLIMPEGTGQLQESSGARRSLYYNIIIALLLCVCAAEVGVLITLPLIQRRLKRPDQQTRWTARTLMMFEDLAIVTRTVADESKEPPQEMDLLLDYLQKEFPLKEYIRSAEAFDPVSGALLDAWGNPTWLVVESPKLYKFVSAGPNGIDDGGQGDDIVYQFNPWEFSEVDEANEPSNEACLKADKEPGP